MRAASSDATASCSERRICEFRYSGSSASRIWFGSCSNRMTLSNGAVSTVVASRFTSNLPSLVVSVNSSSSALSTHLPSTVHTWPCVESGSSDCTTGREAISDTKRVYTSSTLSTFSDTNSENTSSEMAWRRGAGGRGGADVRFCGWRGAGGRARRRGEGGGGARLGLGRGGRVAHLERLHQVVLGPALEEGGRLLADGDQLHIHAQLLQLLHARHRLRRGRGRGGTRARRARRAQCGADLPPLLPATRARQGQGGPPCRPRRPVAAAPRAQPGAARRRARTFLITKLL